MVTFTVSIRIRCLEGVRRRLAALCVVGVMLGGQASAQVDRLWNSAGAGNYGSGPSWSGGFVPEGRFSERAIVNNGGTPEVMVGDSFTDLDSVQGPGDIILGQGESDSGGLLVSGTIKLGDGGGAGVGVTRNVQVGGSGTGTLDVASGGSLSALSITSSGQADSAINLVGGANLEIERDANLNRHLQITGPNVQFSTESVAFGNDATYTAVITGGTHSAIDASLNASLSGNLVADLSAVSPTVGQRWDLVSAGAVTGSFSSVSVVGASFGPLEKVGVAFAADGDRTTVQLAIEQSLQLAVNTTTGEISIVNPTANEVQFNGYSIATDTGALDAAPEAWTGISGADPAWQKSQNSGDFRLTELRPNGFTSLTDADAPVELGAVFGNPTEFGVDPRDMTFLINKDGVDVPGEVEFIGEVQRNNLRIVVDPTTGEAVLQNDSNFVVSIDGYTITSGSGTNGVSGSLLNTWSGLEGSSTPITASNWQRTLASDEFRLTETNPTEVQSLGPGFTMPLGTIFDVGSAQDLVFEYVFDDSDDLLQGIVDYSTSLPDLTMGLPGDFNNDGSVNLADYTIWRDNLGAEEVSVGANWSGDGIIDSVDYAVWKSQFGQTQSGLSVASQAVPEPSALAGFACVLGCLMGAARWNTAC